MRTQRIITAFCLALLAIYSLSCGNTKDEAEMELNKNKEELKTSSMIYKRFEKRVLYGDFDGDGKMDTLKQDMMNYNAKLSIDSFPDPYANEWDTVIGYCYKDEYVVMIKTSIQNVDTLHLGPGIGLYSLINLGDINHDKKDDIALVVDRCDATNVNQCFIYSLCNYEWVPLKIFYVFEAAFYIIDGKVPQAHQIEGYLEKKNNRWFYLDYIEDLQSDDDKHAGKLMPLNLKPCY